MEVTSTSDEFGRPRQAAVRLVLGAILLLIGNHRHKAAHKLVPTHRWIARNLHFLHGVRFTRCEFVIGISQEPCLACSVYSSAICSE